MDSQVYDKHALRLVTAADASFADRLAGDVALAANGDHSAFERLVDTNKSVVCAIALAIVRDWEMSEEIAQDVFVAVWKQIGKLKNPASFLPWLRQITRNRSYDFLRRRIANRARLQPLNDSSVASPEGANPASPDPRSAMIRAEEQEALRSALESLPDETREIVTLFYREDCSIRQVSLLLDLSEDTVKKRLSRARQKLKQDVESRFSLALVRSKPTAALTAAVMAGLAFSAPAGAAAAAMGLTAKSATVIGSAVWALLLGGLAGGVASIAFGKRVQIRQAWDKGERRGLWLSAFGQVAVLCGFLGFTLFWPVWTGTRLKDHPIAALGSVAAYWVGLNIFLLGWDRRVTRRRRRTQRHEQPEVWRAEQRRFVWGSVFSVTLLVVAMAGLGLVLYLRAH